MIRVLHILANIRINSGMTGVVVNYHRHIDKSKIQFDYVYFEDGDNTFEEEIKQLGGKIYKLPKPGFNYEFRKEVNKFFSEHKEYKIIHCHPSWAPFFFGPAAKRNGVKCVIAHTHSTKLGESNLSSIRNYFLRVLSIPFVDEYIACSETAKKSFPLIQKRRVRLLKNAIDLNRFMFREKDRQEIRKSLNVSDATVLVGHIGRFEKPKNHSFIIDVFYQYEKKAETKLLLVGSGSLKNEIENKIDALGLKNNVIILDNRMDVEKIYSAMDVLIFPSLYEGLGLVLIEAQACGLGCVASSAVPDEAEITEYFEKCSIDESAQVWAEKIAYVVKNSENNQRNTSVAELIKNKGYDIVAESSVLVTYYRKLV